MLPAPTSPTLPLPTPLTTNPSEPPATCFSSSNTVYVKDIGSIHNHQLQIGDMVESGHFGTYTQVYRFGHYDHDSETEYILLSMKDNEIKTQGMTALEISSRHYRHYLFKFYYTQGLL